MTSCRSTSSRARDLPLRPGDSGRPLALGRRVPVLVSSGLQIFNAAPYLDARDKSNPARRVLAIARAGAGVGTTTVFGHTFMTTHLLGYTDDGGRRGAARLSRLAHDSRIPGSRRRSPWHLFFAWVLVLCWSPGSSAAMARSARADSAAVRSAETVADAGLLFALAQRTTAPRKLQSVAESRVHGRCCSSSLR